MKTHRLRSLVISTATLLVTLLCAWSPRSAVRPESTMVAFDDAPRADHGRSLPEGFAATVDRATTDRFVRVVADDVDQDGDIDVVASIGSLDLMVWRNDGGGHFTRVLSSQHSALQTQPPAPNVDGQPLGSDEWIQNDDRHAAGQAPPNPVVDAAPISTVFQRLFVIPPHQGPRSRSSRAPPFA